MSQRQSVPGAFPDIHREGKKRCELLAYYVIQTGCTVRDAAKVFCISKSTVHKDITEKLCKLNPGLYDEVRTVLSKNKSERHLRGGIATRNKYLRIRNHGR